ncbi:MAG: hypothetical protein AAGB29_12330 [Planctomycetota bacterium]
MDWSVMHRGLMASVAQSQGSALRLPGVRTLLQAIDKALADPLVTDDDRRQAEMVQRFWRQRLSAESATPPVIHEPTGPITLSTRAPARERSVSGASAASGQDHLEGVENVIYAFAQQDELDESIFNFKRQPSAHATADSP